MRRFFRCTLRQLLLLILAVSVLLAILAPSWWDTARQKQVADATEDLLQAASAGDLPRVSRAIAAGADLNVWDKRWGTPLELAIRDGNLPLVDLLLAAGADPNRHGLLAHGTPLEFAARLNNPEITGRLLAAGADSRRAEAIEICVAKGHEETLRLYLPEAATGRMLRLAISSKRLNNVRLLLEHGAPLHDPATDSDDWSRSPMDLAVGNVDADMTDLLRQFGAPYTAREAVVFGRLEEVRRMVEGNPDLLHQRVKPALYPLNPGLEPTLLGLALRHARRDVALYLIESGAPLDVREWHDESLLDQAAIGGDIELIKLLVERGLPVNPKDKTPPPLYYAAFYGHAAAAAALIELGADVTHELPLFCAVSRNDPVIVRLLVAAGADPMTKGYNGRTPLEVAFQEGRHEIVEILQNAAKTRHDPENSDNSR
jgi:ankyrin repeat protein